jgi:hypothetical protein
MLSHARFEEYAVWDRKLCMNLGTWTKAVNLGITDEQLAQLEKINSQLSNPFDFLTALYQGADSCQYTVTGHIGFPFTGDVKKWARQLENSGDVKDTCLFNAPVCAVDDKAAIANCKSAGWPGLNCDSIDGMMAYCANQWGLTQM